MTEREALKLAREALLDLKDDCSGCEFEWSNDYPLQAKALQAIDKVLAQLEQGPNLAEAYRTELDKLSQRNYELRMENAKLKQPKEPEQEPVAWMYPDALCDKACLYLCTKGFTQFPECATPPQRKPLTDEMTKQMRESCDSHEMRGAFVDGWLSAEAAHGIKE